MFDEIEETCRAALGHAPEALEFPGGIGRKTMIAVVRGRRYVISRRRSEARARLEAGVLRALAPTGAVPGLLHRGGRWIVQEHVPGPRLSGAIDAADGPGAETLMDRGATGLVAMQQEGARAGLASRVPPLGTRDVWLDELLSMPARLADTLGMEPPRFDAGAARPALRAGPPVFVKWDARTGNAILGDDGRIRWIDWEHCGARNAVDDLVWMFGDEWTPDCPEVERAAVTRLADAHGLERTATAGAFAAMGALHACVRLALILARKGEGGWWSHGGALAADRVGVTRRVAARLARRGARWSEAAPGMSPLSGFFGAVPEHLPR
ncbi:phosphotransferase family protein [Jannaschia sp. W003]|uniref:phosphotransferase family protein n=1 Tax=Jannaschia sp. W003 TaxID=2867012 RepID=UPI0021A67D53|nr:hypothetical protein [Jannaschia sp. W003]UWQ20168.1 hypothetical protein K3554_09125 [Jannaschia sp. W003]